MHFRSMTAILLFTFAALGVWRVNEIRAQDTAPAPVPFQAMVRLAPENTRIEFIGTHVGDEPRPRLGGFSEFSGNIVVDAEKKVIESIEVEMQIESVWTEFDKLTAHLKNADFFEVSKYPTARFQSTRITTLQNGTCNVTGELTLHGETSEIVFPANYEIGEKGLVLSAQFVLDRTQFGMSKMTDGVEKMVSISVSVGTPTRNVDSREGHGGETSGSTSTEKGTTNAKSLTVYLPNMT